jgi:uncharacterized PurR-regulated membrane protein YhhQ (DUF165 family)
MRNEYIFIVQLIFISFFLKKFNTIGKKLLLSQIIVASYLLMNLLANYEVVLFGFSSSIIEPLAIANYFVTIYLWSYDQKLCLKVTNNLFFTSFFSTIILFIISLYSCIKANYIIHQFIYNTLVSIIVIQITYRIERLVFNYCSRLALAWRAKVSLLISQIFDTAFYTALIFSHAPIEKQVQIALFSYIIKTICIVFYTASQI